MALSEFVSRKAELQAEIDRLNQHLLSSSAADVAVGPRMSGSMIPQSPGAARVGESPLPNDSHQIPFIYPPSVMTTSPNATDMAGTTFTPASAQKIEDLEFSGGQISDCFSLYT